MTVRDRYRRFCALVIGIVAASVIFGVLPASAQSGPFSGLAGSWSGGGKINFSDGTADRLRCRATYSVGGGGTQAQLTLRCASDSYNFNLSSSIQSQGGSVSGSWSESTRGIGGTLSGSASARGLQLQVIGPAFAAGLSLSVNGNRQVVSIAAPASQITSATITLTRGS
jgi:hypothetical protein